MKTKAKKVREHSKPKGRAAAMAKSNKKPGTEKFTDRFDVEEKKIYCADADAMTIPDRRHPLYDETSPTEFSPPRAAAIDERGEMTDAIEVWPDPDSNTLWVIDGRSRLLDVREVNRRRKEEGREPVKPNVVVFTGDEKSVIVRVRQKNFQRRLPTPSAYGINIDVLRRAGCTWEKCAETLNIVTDDAEQWCRKRLPLAFCVQYVREAVDGGEIPITAARKFGGGKPDGSDRLGDREQEALLKKMLAGERAKEKKQLVSPKMRERAAAALFEASEAKSLKATDNIGARAIAFAFEALSGKTEKLELKFPGCASILKEAFKPQPAGRPKKSNGANGVGKVPESSDEGGGPIEATG